MADEVARLVAFGARCATRACRRPRARGRVLPRGRGARPPGPVLGRAADARLPPEEIPVYDRVFRGVLRRRSRLPAAGDRRARRRSRSRAGEELLRTKSFAALTREELLELAELMRRLRLTVPSRRTRRRERARRGDPDLRRTLRRSFRTGGEPVERVWRARRRRGGGSCCCSTSPARWRTTRVRLSLFARAALQADTRWEAFCFGTRLTRVTRRSPAPTPRRRCAAPARRSSTGTAARASAMPCARSRARTSSRGRVVVICSDGLDVGEPEVLRAEMARLARLAHRVVWLNPLKEDPAYEPLARGMQAALPHVDVLPQRAQPRQPGGGRPGVVGSLYAMPQARPIVFLSDFGPSNEWVGVCHAGAEPDRAREPGRRHLSSHPAARRRGRSKFARGSAPLHR